MSRCSPVMRPRAGCRSGCVTRSSGWTERPHGGPRASGRLRDGAADPRLVTMAWLGTSFPRSRRWPAISASTTWPGRGCWARTSTATARSSYGPRCSWTSSSVSAGERRPGQRRGVRRPRRGVPRRPPRTGAAHHGGGPVRAAALTGGKAVTRVVEPVTCPGEHPNGGADDPYEPSTAMRRTVEVRDLTCIFPGARDRRMVRARPHGALAARADLSVQPRSTVQAPSPAQASRSRLALGQSR